MVRFQHLRRLSEFCSAEVVTDEATNAGDSDERSAYAE